VVTRVPGLVRRGCLAAVKERRFLNRGFLNGPLFPIYGIGVTLVVLALEPYRDDLGVLYLASAVLVTVLEYIKKYCWKKYFIISGGIIQKCLAT
jgi:uncharacterized membrane protein